MTSVHPFETLLFSFFCFEDAQGFARILSDDYGVVLGFLYLCICEGDFRYAFALKGFLFGSLRTSPCSRHPQAGGERGRGVY